MPCALERERLLVLVTARVKLAGSAPSSWGFVRITGRVALGVGVGGHVISAETLRRVVIPATRLRVPCRSAGVRGPTVDAGLALCCARRRVPQAGARRRPVGVSAVASASYGAGGRPWCAGGAGSGEAPPRARPGALGDDVGASS